MNAQELKQHYEGLYDYMVATKKTENMMLFGNVMTAMMHDMIASSPSKAEEYINRLEAIKWDNYLTPQEADRIVEDMEPSAPWSREQWRTAMEQHGFPLEKQPCYNRCALYVAMNMVMSDSEQTLAKYIGSEEMFSAVHDLAVDKLTDEDNMFKIRKYFRV